MVFPIVKQYVVGKGICHLPDTVTCVGAADDALAMLGANALTGFFEGAVCREGDAFVSFAYDPSLPEEAEIYRVTVKEHSICVGFRDARGAVNGAATVSLLLCQKEIEQCEIVDYPSCGFRSMMLDLARGVPKLEDVEGMIRYIALAKMNTLHLHLMDSRGLCYLSDVVPEYRYMGVGEPCEKSYLQRIRALCNRYAIDIIPEIEIPAHANALCASRPDFRCDVEEEIHWTICPGSEGLYPFFDALIGEIAELFPESKYIHAGSDELEFRDLTPPRYCSWDRCPKCAALRRREGLEDLRAEFYYVMEQVHQMIRRRGKRMIMWNDQIDVSRDVTLSREIVVEFWRIAGEGRGPVEGCTFDRFLELGFSVINAHYRYTYTDVEKYLSPEKMKKWVPFVNLEQEPVPSDLILGGETCAWEFGNYAEYPFYGYVAPATAAIFGDKLWGLSEREYDQAYREGLATLLFGAGELSEVFDHVGDILPPRSTEQFTYLDADRICRERVLVCAERLSGIGRGWAVSKYVELLQKIAEQAT